MFNLRIEKAVIRGMEMGSFMRRQWVEIFFYDLAEQSFDIYWWDPVTGELEL